MCPKVLCKCGMLPGARPRHPPLSTLPASTCDNDKDILPVQIPSQDGCVKKPHKLFIISSSTVLQNCSFTVLQFYSFTVLQFYSSTVLQFYTSSGLAETSAATFWSALSTGTWQQQQLLTRPMTTFHGLLKTIVSCNCILQTDNCFCAN